MLSFIEILAFCLFSFIVLVSSWALYILSLLVIIFFPSHWFLFLPFSLHSHVLLINFCDCVQYSIVNCGFPVLLVVQMVKNLLKMLEMWVQFMGWEDPLGQGWLPTPVFLPGEFHGQRSLVLCNPWGHKESQSMGLERVGHDWATNTHTHARARAHTHTHC